MPEPTTSKPAAADPAVPGAAVPDPGPATEAEPPAPAARVMNEEDRAPMGLTVRVFIYLVAVHFFVGFLFLLFKLGGA
ncbi:DUF6126 family protein [Streptomyces sp. H27-D2]|uniref:DUF6126 family protein n=1 Tax=Streptomyces sp. H27-D2 TaxID=3046304 RepID=UPI002DBC89C0|nr:DUF6126 family protein [Streptomyces sp. H27-D2]MEC4018165.1 DUF6126 family protein [Streptomyces sp. H27-D2]